MNCRCSNFTLLSRRIGNVKLDAAVPTGLRVVTRDTYESVSARSLVVFRLVPSGAKFCCRRPKSGVSCAGNYFISKSCRATGWGVMEYIRSLTLYAPCNVLYLSNKSQRDAIYFLINFNNYSLMIIFNIY
jgi:hypothetical protein